MNKLLSAASAIGMLLAVNAAQAGEVMTPEQLDTVTAGAFAAVSTSANNAVSNGTYSLAAFQGSFASASIFNQNLACTGGPGCSIGQSAVAIVP